MRDAVKDVHIVVGILSLGLNLLAFVLGAAAWLRRGSSPWFWRTLRSGQAVVAVEAALGGVLLLMGEKATNLHYLYGALPLVVAMIAEQLKLSAATMVLDSRELEDAQAVGSASAGRRTSGRSSSRSCGASSAGDGRSRPWSSLLTRADWRPLSRKLRSYPPCAYDGRLQAAG